MLTYYSVTSSSTISTTLCVNLTERDEISRVKSLTDEVIEPEERASEFPIVLHDDPDARPNASIDQL